MPFFIGAVGYAVPPAALILPTGGARFGRRTSGPPCRTAPPQYHGVRYGGAEMAKSPGNARAKALAAALVNALGLPMMQEIADLVPKRGRGHPGLSREDEFHKVCFIFITEPEFSFKFAAEAVYQTFSKPALQVDSFVSRMNTSLSTAKRNNENFLADEADRIASENLGTVRPDLFPKIAERQKLSLQIRKIFALSSLQPLKLPPSLANLKAIEAIRNDDKTFKLLVQMGHLDQAFQDLIPDETPADLVAEVYWLIRQLMEAWARENNI
jgi:hypothetical protein